MTALLQHGPRYLGRGRSGVVYLDRTPTGESVAVKVFSPDGVTRGLMTLLTGAPNPYGWCEDAAHCVVLRRRILGTLAATWFGDRLSVPLTAGPRWNGEHRAYEITCALIRSRHLPLTMHGGRDGASRAMRTLVKDIMQPLQRRLIESGCIGMVWQAGLGNPVAGGNFMLAPRDRIGNGEAADRWVWIDLESGIPALLPLNPLAMLRFYLPQMLRRGALLFDDIDVPRLQEYIAAQRNAIVAAVGEAAFAQLECDVEQLGKRQTAWKSLSRLRRSLLYARAVERIDDGQFDWYSRRPVRWYARLAAQGVTAATRAMAMQTRRFIHWLAHRHWRLYARALRDFCLSQRFRTHVSKRYVYRRIVSWKQRRFITPSQSRHLRSELRGQDTSNYICDFGMHIAIKPLVKITQYIILPSLLAAGLISATTLAVGIVTGGAVGRTIYTLIRIGQCMATGKRAPWVALAVGALPWVGGSAFAAQLLYASTDRRQLLPRFMLYDSLASVGRAAPIWGGRDSLVEHFFNRLPNVFFRNEGDNATDTANDITVEEQLDGALQDSEMPTAEIQAAEMQTANER